MAEVWKPIQGYDELYEVSNLGKVRTIKTGVIRKITLDGNGYLQLSLCKNGLQKSFKVHRLVANAFIPNPNNYREINHKDENKQNNCVDNLEWCTRLYNMRYGNCHNNKKIPVVQLDKQGNVIHEFSSIADATKQFNKAHNSNIKRCCDGMRKTCCGYVWKYKESE